MTFKHHLGYLFLFVVFFTLSCNKEDEKHTVQYEVWSEKDNELEFRVQYLNPYKVQSTTGVIDEPIWKSKVYEYSNKDAHFNIELLPENRIYTTINVVLVVRKDGSVAYKKQLTESHKNFVFVGIL